MPQDETKNKSMIEEWLKKNKPSVQFKDEAEMGHVTPMSAVGTGIYPDGGKLW